MNRLSSGDLTELHSVLSRQRARADLDSGDASGESYYTTSHCGLSQ